MEHLKNYYYLKIILDHIDSKLENCINFYNGFTYDYSNGYKKALLDIKDLINSLPKE